MKTAKIKVYLAGGFRSGWQYKVQGACPELDFLDPREKSEATWSIDQIGAWDFLQIKRSDIVFAYLERNNPSGFGLAVEIGYARGKDKIIILVLEQGHEIHKDKYLAFLKTVADVTFSDFDEAILYLLSFAR